MQFFFNLDAAATFVQLVVCGIVSGEWQRQRRRNDMFSLFDMTLCWKKTLASNTVFGGEGASNFDIPGRSSNMIYDTSLCLSM